MSDYSIRIQVLLNLELKKKLEYYKDCHGYVTSSMAIREILKKAFDEEFNND